MDSVVEELNFKLFILINLRVNANSHCGYWLPYWTVHRSSRNNDCCHSADWLSVKKTFGILK